MKYVNVIFLFFLIQISWAQLPLQKQLDRANAYYKAKQYVLAIDDYERFLTKNNHILANLHLADCYSKTNNTQEAVRCYQKLVLAKSIQDTVFILYAEELKKLEKYAEAKKQYLELYAKRPEMTSYKRYADYCDSSILHKEKQLFKIVNLGKCNTEFSELTPVCYKNGIVFSSNREHIYIEKKAADKLPFFDLYFASGKDSLCLDRVSNFSSRLNSIDHECCASFTKDYKKIFFSRTTDEQPNDGGKNTIKMFSATFDGTGWQNLHVFRFNDTTHSYGQPTVEANEELFFFASDIAGGYGGTDIYVCFNIDNKWTDPVNLGPEVNSAYNELYPFFHSDGTLYFSSNRPLGMGGYDIYKSTENEEGDYANVQNLYSPINSCADDLSIFWKEDYSVGYFSSNRKGGKGMEDLYRIDKR